MKSLRRILLILTAFAAACALSSAAPSAPEQNKPVRIAVVNFKQCVEKSKTGKKEQARFESMKKEMEKVLSEKEKALTDVAAQFNDINYLDSLSPEAETKLKQQYRTLNQEFSQQQNQFYQQLSQANVSIIQKLQEIVDQVSEEIAKKQQIDLVLNDEVAFYVAPSLDISDLIIKALDEAEEKENAKSKTTIPARD